MFTNRCAYSFAEAREKLFAFDEICTELSAFSTYSPALIAYGCVDRERPQQI